MPKEKKEWPYLTTEITKGKAGRSKVRITLETLDDRAILFAWIAEAFHKQLLNQIEIDKKHYGLE